MKKARKTPTIEQKAWLKENGYTVKQMDEFWQENIETNFLIRNLNKNGMSWRDLNMSCVEKLPTQKQRDAESRAKTEVEAKAKIEQEAKAKADKEYYEEHFEELMVKKIENNENLTECELSRLTEYEESREEGDSGRWTKGISSVLLLCDRYFILKWSAGLTEYQENEFYSQPYEVKKHTYEKTITVTEWQPVKERD